MKYVDIVSSCDKLLIVQKLKGIYMYENKLDRLIDLTYEIMDRQKERSGRGYTIQAILGSMPEGLSMDERIQYLEDKLMEL